MTTRTQVLDRFIENASRANYVHQFLTYLGDTSSSAYNLPSAALGAVGTSGTSRGAPVQPTLTNQALNVNLHRSHNLLLSSLQQRQVLGGAYIGALADEAYDSIMAQLDDSAYDALLEACVAAAGQNTVAFDGGNVSNGALAAVTRDIVARFEADLVGPGNRRGQFLHFASPRAFGAIRSLYDSQIGSVPVTSPMLGVDFEAVSVNGIPVIEAQSMPNQIEVAGSASSITSDVATVTVPAGHGLQVGMSVYTSGFSANVASGSETPITAASATSISFALTATDAADNGTGSVIVPAAVSMLVPRNKAFWAGDPMPAVKDVDDAENSGGMALQCYADFGREVIDGAARMLLWPS